MKRCGLSQSICSRPTVPLRIWMIYPLIPVTRTHRVVGVIADHVQQGREHNAAGSGVRGCRGTVSLPKVFALGTNDLECPYLE